MGNRFGASNAMAVAIFFCMIGMITGQISGTNSNMDTDLGDVSASFIGEGEYDKLGMSVGCVGDVNGDGYDDFLMGAPLYDDGVRNGKCYLFFGKPSGWAMDTDLSNANASFYGDEVGDSMGHAVTGVGDVNKDGYDDMLMSSVWSHRGRTIGGKTCLILGKGSGWSLDTNLSTADASFLGEDYWDWSGASVAGAGDVNGDGYDDFLIGAPRNNEAGEDAGQAYLILGKASGWSLDTDLADADASFLGEWAWDFAGNSVSGGGDVNGDGYDDILIGANENDDIQTNAGQVYLFFGRPGGWAMDTPLSAANASFLGENGADYLGDSVDASGDVNGDGYSDIIIGASQYGQGYNENAGQTYIIMGKASGWTIDTDMSNADGSFIGERTGDRSGISVSGSGDINGDGYNDILIGAHGRYTGSVNGGETYLVLGQPSGWSMDSKLSDADASFIGEASWDYSGYSLDGSGDYNGDGHDDILIGAMNNDEGGTHAGQVYLIDDLDMPPSVITDSTPSQGYTGDNLDFNISAFDDWGISAVTIEYWYRDSQPHTNISTGLASGDIFKGTWLKTLTIPSDARGPLHYIVHLEDDFIHLTSSEVKDVDIIDDDRPTFVSDVTDPIATTGDPFAFKVHAIDNIEIGTAHVLYWWGTMEPINATMTTDGIDPWTHRITVPSDSLEPINYRFEFVDTATNWNTSSNFTIVPTDNDAPTIIEDLTPENATTGDDLTFSIELEENIGIETASLSYHYGEGTSANIPLEQGDTWMATITVENTQDALHYTITVRDTSGNGMISPVRTVYIIDDDPPVLVMDLTKATATTGDPLTFTAEVIDNVGVGGVYVEHWFVGDLAAHENELMVEDPPGIWSLSIPVPSDSLVPVQYRLSMDDLAENRWEGPMMNVPVVDNDGPEITFWVPDESPIKGMPMEILCESTDNIAFEGLYVVYRYGDGEIFNESTGLYIHLEVPRHPGGDLYLRVLSVDTAGNWNSTKEYTFTLLNSPPEIEDLPTWKVGESTDAEFALVNYINDLNDETFTVTCSDDNVTVDGMVLKVHHDEAVPDRTVTLTVSDGDDEVEATLTIHVVNVNDLPIITDLLPVDGTKFKKGKLITFSVNATDEDGDILNITWMDGDKVLGTGSHIGWSKLSKGEHTITVVVDDGTGTVEESFIIKVTEEEESPGPGLVAALAALVLAGLVGARRRGQRPAW